MTDNEWKSLVRYVKNQGKGFYFQLQWSRNKYMNDYRIYKTLQQFIHKHTQNSIKLWYAHYYRTLNKKYE